MIKTMDDLKAFEFLYDESVEEALQDFAKSSHRQGYHNKYEIVSAFCRENDISYSLVDELIQYL